MKLRTLLAAAGIPPRAVSASARAAQPAGAAALKPLTNGVEITNGVATLRVTALTDGILRVRIARGAAFSEDASWAVPRDVRMKSVPVRATGDGFTTGALAVHIDAATLGLTVTDLQGKAIVADAPEALRFDGRGFTLRKALPIDQHIFALGDKTGPLDRRGSTFRDWNPDAFGFAPSSDPIYKSIPFYIGSDSEGRSYGLFLDNSWRSSFDFGHKDAGAIEMSAPDGPIDYYVIAGPSVGDVVRRYSDLTGKAPITPLWALGYQQSRWGYSSDPEVRGIAQTLRADRIPADIIWMDIDYQDRYRPFTVDRSKFPDLKKLNSDLNADGIRLVAITDLHIAYAPNQGYAPLDAGLAANHFVRKADGSLYVAPVWPGPAVFPDFTRTASRDWWGSLYKDFIADGFAGLWNDMNEPAVFETPTKTMPPANLHRVDSDDFAPRDPTHANIHNAYGMQNTHRALHGRRLHAAALLRLAGFAEEPLRQIDELHVGAEPDDRRTAQAGIASALLGLPAGGRLVQLLDRSPGHPAQADADAQARRACGVRPRRHDPAAPAVGAEHDAGAARAPRPRHLSRRKFPRPALLRRPAPHRPPE